MSNTYAVTYKPGANGSGTQQTVDKTLDVALALKGAIFTRTGYTQTGWSTSDGGSKVYELAASYTTNAAVTLYPFWTANTYTVTYKPGANGSGTQQTAKKTHGVALALKGATFSRSGYTQTGWSKSDGGSKAYDLGASYTANAAVTLYPFWTATDTHGMVQLWAGGPYWATMNIGAEEPWDYGYYFWWGDTVGYRRSNNKWIASDGSSSNFSFAAVNTPTEDKNGSTLRAEGWITTDNTLAFKRDAARAQWGGEWRMPTKQELADLVSNCDWTWTTLNSVRGYIVRGKGSYADSSIFLPCAGIGDDTWLDYAGARGCYRSSSMYSSDFGGAWELDFESDLQRASSNYRRYHGKSIRPVRSVSK